MTPEFECSCKACVASCHKKPGMFLPEQIQPLADVLGLSFEELVKTRLMVESGDRTDGGKVFLLSPKTVGGHRFGTCTFLKDERCEIHELGKPHQCAMATHKDGADLNEILAAWLPYQHVFVPAGDGTKPAAGSAHAEIAG